jgi:hypothetical protein
MAVMVVLLLGLAIVLTGPILWLEIDEAAVPPSSDAPALPDGISAVHQGVNCASGGYWREWTLSGPQSWSEAEVAASVDISGESCAARSPLDRREVCTWLKIIGDEVRLFQQFDRPLG